MLGQAFKLDQAIVGGKGFRYQVDGFIKVTTERKKYGVFDKTYGVFDFERDAITVKQEDIFSTVYKHKINN